jgi:hypothetical protein
VLAAMLTAAAVCPHPPLLIPGATGAPGLRVPADEGLGRLRAACDQAVAALLAGRPDLIAVVGASRRTMEYPADAAAGLHDFGVPFAAGGGSPVLPLSLTVGKWLLSRAAAGPDTPRAGCWGIAADAAPAECLALGERLAALAPRVAVLAMGDGPGRRARTAPGAADPEADRYDDQVAASLAAPDPGALAALDPGQDSRLFVAGRPAWQVLAGAAGRGRFDACLRYRGAPFEVTYFVASWLRRAAGPGRAH